MKIIKNTTLIAALWVTMSLPLSAKVSPTEQISAFDKAMQYVEKGQWQSAETLLSFELENSPHQHRARLELALVQMQLQKLDEAKTNLMMLTKVNDLPKNVRYNIDLLLSEMSQTDVETDEKVVTGSSWSAQLSLAAGYDDNVRFSFGDYYLDDDPYLQGFLIVFSDGTQLAYSSDGLLYDALGNSYTPESLGIDLGPLLEQPNSAFTESNLLLKHDYLGNNWKWHNEFYIRSVDNQDFSDYDRLTLKLDSSVNWLLSNNQDIGFGLEKRQQYRGGNEQISSIAAKLDYNLYYETGQWQFYTQYMQRDFKEIDVTIGGFTYTNAGFENKSWGLGVEWDKLFLSNRLLLKINLEVKRNKASDDLNYRGAILKSALVYKLNTDWSLAAYLNMFHQNYDDNIVKNASDRSIRVGTKIDYQLTPNVGLFLSSDWGERKTDIYFGSKSDTYRVKTGLNLEF